MARRAQHPTISRENKRERFVRLAQQRMARALHTIRLIGNLANKNNYDFEDTDARKMVAALDAEVEVLKRRFDDTKARKKREFKL